MYLAVRSYYNFDVKLEDITRRCSKISLKKMKSPGTTPSLLKSKTNQKQIIQE